MKLKHQRQSCKPSRFAEVTVKHDNSFHLENIIKLSFICFAVLVIFVTAYALILPAKTQSGISCKIDEHSHGEECYLVEEKLTCEVADEEHQHTPDCYISEKTLVCDVDVHIHSAECYSEINDQDITEPVALDDDPPPELSDKPDLSMYTDFVNYINNVEKGKIKSELYDKDSNMIDNIYEASGQGYTYYFSVEADKILPDEYIYYLPKGMTVDIASKTGEISNKSSVIGSYEISDDSTYIIFYFNHNADDFQSIKGEISLLVEFEEIIKSNVHKEGSLFSDEGLFDGYFHFEIKAKIPAVREGAQKREWSIVDRAELINQWVYDFENTDVTKDLRISIAYGDVTDEEIFNIKDVYQNEDIDIAYYIDPSTKALYLVNRCNGEDDIEYCANAHKDVGDNKVKCNVLKDYPQWCTCWSKAENTELTIKYKTALDGYKSNSSDDYKTILGDQNTIVGNEGDSEVNKYENRVTLTGRYYDLYGNRNDDIKKHTAKVEYNSILSKTESNTAKPDNGYESVFAVTFNKDKFNLLNTDANEDGVADTEIVLTDTMHNLKYIPGSMVITTEDKDGNKAELKYGDHFTVDVEQTDDGANLRIIIMKLGEYRYDITYNATVYYKGENVTIDISNNASLEMYTKSKQYTSPTYKYRRRFSYSDNWDYVRYEINILKVDYYNEEMYLPGAVFGLYASDGHLMAEEETDENGGCIFKTDATQGLIYQNDQMYYITETKAPDGYELDTLQHWFYFGKTKNVELENEHLKKYPNADIHYVGLTNETDYILNIKATNEKLFTLPATGGSGQFVFIITGAAITILSLGCIIIKKRKSGFNQS